VLGTINPVTEIVKTAKKINPSIIAVIDCAKAAPCMPITVEQTGADFVVFSLHKMLGPTGIGILWGKKQLLDTMQPFQYGGGTIREVALEKTAFADIPHKFEAGTPHIAGVIASKEAIKYLSSIGMANIQAHEQTLAACAIKRLKEEFADAIQIYGPKQKELRSGLVSFNFKNYHPHDVAQILDEENIAIRAGHHCAMPLHKRLGITATARASFYIYNDTQDVEKLIEGLKKTTKIFS
jgi:cysteine desulfurase/selenocysteine lyase